MPEYELDYANSKVISIDAEKVVIQIKASGLADNIYLFGYEDSGFSGNYKLDSSKMLYTPVWATADGNIHEYTLYPAKDLKAYAGKTVYFMTTEGDDWFAQYDDFATATIPSALSDEPKIATEKQFGIIASLIKSGGGGGSNVKLYNSYGTNTDGAVTQDFINTKLNKDKIAIGINSSATGDEDLAIGINAAATGRASQALGGDSAATGHQSLAVGNAAKSGGDGYGVAVGSFSKITGGAAGVAIGYNCESSKQGAVAIGYNAKGYATGAVAIGFNANADNTGYNIAIGCGSKATGSYSTAIGGSFANDGNDGAQATGAWSTAVGLGARALDTSATAFGCTAYANNSMSTAIGHSAKCTAGDCVAIGSSSQATEYRTVSFGSSSTKRRLVNISDGINDNDAVTVAQLRKVYNGQNPF